jgi:hypothetical protein
MPSPQSRYGFSLISDSEELSYFCQAQIAVCGEKPYSDRNEMMDFTLQMRLYSEAMYTAFSALIPAISESFCG